MREEGMKETGTERMRKGRNERVRGHGVGDRASVKV